MQYLLNSELFWDIDELVWRCEGNGDKLVRHVIAWREEKEEKGEERLEILL